MHLIWFLVIGIIAGWLASWLVKGQGLGLFGDMVLGIIGTYLGDFLFRKFSLSAHGMLGQIIMATAGAIALLVVVRVLRRL